MSQDHHLLVTDGSEPVVMNIEYPCEETEALDDVTSRELLESERSWDRWMEEVCAILDAQSPQLGPKAGVGFERQLVACLLDD